jgi:hypothetical protein
MVDRSKRRSRTCYCHWTEPTGTGRAVADLLEVRWSSLAACVRALTDEGDLMSFELHQRKHLEDELTKIVRQQLRDTAHALTTSAGNQFRSAVHESRKSAKKVRAVAALLTQAGAKLPRRDRRRVKSAASALSRVRDTTAIIETFDRVRRRYPKQLPEHTCEVLRHGLVAARDRSEARAARRRQSNGLT